MTDFIERRRRYRSPVPDSVPLTVHLDFGGGATQAAELVDLSAGGAGIKCWAPVPVTLGAEIVLQITMASTALRLPAVVVSKIELADGARMGLQFKEEIRPDLDLPGAVRELLNRRRALRVAPAGSVEMIVRAHEDTTGETQIVGLLIDLSTTGVSAWLDATASSTEHELVLLSFEPQPGLPFDFAARVRDRKRGAGPRVRFTFEFDAEETVGYREQVRALSLYIRARQQELLTGAH